jgi:DNA-binding NarL/FixJ family response regulator
MTPRAPQDGPDPIRIVVADDHPIVRAGIVGLLETAPGIEVVGEAADACAISASTRATVISSGFSTRT